MRRIIAIHHVTLDGVMQAPGGPEEDPRDGFTQGGWAMRFSDETGGEALSEIMAGEFDLLLGRRTYEIFAAYWPYAGDNVIAEAFNKATKHVVTRSLDRFDWVNTQGIGGDAVDEIRRLKASDGPELHIWGSGELLQTLIAADVIDEFRVWVYPVLLGRGKRLFEDGLPPRGLTLVESRSTPTGVLLNTYRPAGPLPEGPPAPENPSQAELARRRKLADEDGRGSTGGRGIIFRKWSGRIRTAQADEYVRYVEETGGAHYAETQGNLGYQILLRELGDGTSEISTVSWWTNLDAVRRFAGDDYDVARYYPEDDQYLLTRPELVEHHEVRSSDLARLAAAAGG